MKRIDYIDFLKFFAIFSMLLGHSVEQTSADLFWDHPVWEAVYAWHMPLFIFISGFFFRSSLKKDFGTLAVDKLRRLGVPSLAAFALQVAVMLIAGVTAVADIASISVNGFINSVWFLKCLLLCIFVMYPVCKLIKNDFVAAAVACVAVLLIPGAHIVNLNFMLPVFCLGMLCGNHYDAIDSHRSLWLIGSAVIFFTLFIFWSGRLTVYMVPTRLFDAGTFDIQNLSITVYRLVLGMSGAMMFFLLAKPVWTWISRFSWSPLLNDIGRNTLGIYVLQTFLLEMLVNSFHIYIPIPLSYLAAPVLAIVELGVCYGLTRLICKSRAGAFLLMGEPLKIHSK